MEFFRSEQWLFFLQELRLKGRHLHLECSWPAWQMQACGWLGVYRWFGPKEFEGWGWSDSEIVRGYLDLSQACLTTAFILTQRSAAMKRIASTTNASAKERWLPGLVTGEHFATIGISHLTTSQQATNEPSLVATPRDGGYSLSGFTPWVTGAAHAQVLVIGATTADGQQCMFAVPTDLPGVVCGCGKELVALSASCTDRVEFHDVQVSQADLLDGPGHDLMAVGKGGSTGGLQTSTLAVGLATEAVGFLSELAMTKSDLKSVAEKLRKDVESLRLKIFQAANGSPDCSLQEIRQRANSLVLRVTQAALTVAKGTGFTEGHPVGIWARQALFFLVWSCPQNVASANLCELAGLDSLS